MQNPQKLLQSGNHQRITIVQGNNSVYNQLTSQDSQPPQQVIINQGKIVINNPKQIKLVTTNHFSLD